MEEVFVHLFPSRGGNNAYIDLLSGALHGTVSGRFSFRVFPQTFPHLLLATFCHPSQKRIIHIHWPNALYGSRYIVKSLLLLGLLSVTLLTLRLFFPCRIVWTKHNYYSHDYPHPWIDYMGCRLLFWFADAVIVHQESEAGRLSTQKVQYIPHGNYCDAYGRRNADAAVLLRQRLGIAEHDIVLIALGIVKPYKKLEAIIEVFCSEALRGRENLKLVIAGECKEPYRKVLQEKIGGDPRVLFLPDHVPHEQIAAYLGMSDYAVFWYDDSVLTSGSIMLALSYGVPVIARRIPASDMIASGENGFLYETVDELSLILRDLLSQTPLDREQIIETVRALSWNEIAKKTTALYAELLT